MGVLSALVGWAGQQGDVHAVQQVKVQPTDQTNDLESTDATHAAESTPTTDELRQQEIKALIEMLGHPSFAARRRARSELQRFGLEALDQLQQSQFDLDSEIAMSSRRLIASRSIDWARSTDSKEVKTTLKSYGSLPLAQRAVKLGRLALLEHPSAVDALARLTRFETDPRLSLVAAISAINTSHKLTVRYELGRQSADDTRDELVLAILRNVGKSDRVGCDWLRRQVEDLRSGSFDSVGWARALQLHRTELDRAVRPEMDRVLMLRLMRSLATKAADLGLVEEAVLLAQEHLDLVPPTNRDLIDTATWAVENELDPLVTRLQSMHSRLFRKDALLVYITAEVAMSRGDIEESESLAKSALAINPIPPEGERDGLSEIELERRGFQHNTVGNGLRKRGYARWAEREFKFVMDSMPIDSRVAAGARYQLASMRSDLFDHDGVIEVLAPLIERLKIDKEAQKKLSNVCRHEELQGLSDFHLGHREWKKGNVQQAIEGFESAYKNGPQQRVDALIAMYRIQGGGETFEASVRQRIEKMTLDFDRNVQRAASEYRRMGNSDDNGAYASALNDYAWLVANTFGLYDRALQCSEKSLEIFEDEPTFLDTLARCHFALGNMEEAIKFQRRAVELEPHQPPLLRQLKEFENAQAATP